MGIEGPHHHPCRGIIDGDGMLPSPAGQQFPMGAPGERQHAFFTAVQCRLHISRGGIPEGRSAVPARGGYELSAGAPGAVEAAAFPGGEFDPCAALPELQVTCGIGRDKHGAVRAPVHIPDSR